MITDDENNLLELFDASYKPLENSMKLTIRVQPIIAESYTQFVTDAMNTFRGAIMSACNYTPKFRVASAEELDSRITERLKENGYQINHLHTMYYHLADVLSFPYIIVKNTEAITNNKSEWDLCSASAENMYNMLMYLVKLRRTMKDTPLFLERSIICKPNDIIFIANPRTIKSKWVNRTPLEMGCVNDSLYVKKILPLFKGVMDVGRLTPFYYMRFGDKLQGECTITLYREFFTDSFRNNVEMFSASTSIINDNLFSDANTLLQNTEAFSKLRELSQPLLPRGEHYIVWNKSFGLLQ